MDKWIVRLLWKDGTEDFWGPFDTEEEAKKFEDYLLHNSMPPVASVVLPLMHPEG